MSRRTWVMAGVIITLIATALFSSMPASASHTRDVAPASIDPTALRLPSSALPAGATVVHAAVSDNADAGGTTTPSDGDKSVFGTAHYGPTSYDAEGRITGYRMDIHYTVGGAPAGIAYLASIYPTADKAHTAFEDATGPMSLVRLLGPTLLPALCTVGDECAAFTLVNPLDPTTQAVTAAFRDGPILVELASDVPAAQFAAVSAQYEADIHTILVAADAQIKLALNPAPPGPPGGSATTTPTSTPTDTPTATPTDTPTATSTPPAVKKACPKNAKRKGGKCTCKKGYTMKKGKCVKKKKRGF